jgi:hypothetical protein
LLLKRVFGFSATERNVGANRTFFILENNGKILKEVGQSTNLNGSAILILEGNVADPSSWESITIDHWTHPKKTSLSRTIADVIVESQFFRDGSPGFFIRGTIIKGRLDSAIDFGFEVTLIPLIASRTKKFYWCGCCAIPHGASNNECCKENSGNCTRQYRFNVPHPQSLVEPFGRSGRDVKDASNDADNAGSYVVGNDSTRIEWIESFGSPRGLNLFKVTSDAVGV